MIAAVVVLQILINLIVIQKVRRKCWLTLDRNHMNLSQPDVPVQQRTKEVQIIQVDQKVYFRNIYIPLKSFIVIIYLHIQKKLNL